MYADSWCPSLAELVRRVPCRGTLAKIINQELDTMTLTLTTLPITRVN
jgi:hypothetical protein